MGKFTRGFAHIHRVSTRPLAKGTVFVAGTVKEGFSKAVEALNEVRSEAVEIDSERAEAREVKEAMREGVRTAAKHVKTQATKTKAAATAES